MHPGRPLSRWFTPLTLLALSLAAGDPPVLQVHRDPLVNGTINPMQYGQFVEYLCDLVPSMWAERLYDGSFEGPTPYKFAFIRQTDFREKPWYPSGAVNRGDYVLDRTNHVTGAVSQRIATRGGEPCTLGLSQDGIFVDRGEGCVFACWMKADGIRGDVEVRIHREGRLLARCAFRPGAEWRRYESRLVSTAREVNATLTVEFHGPGTLWLDNASLMPVATVGGWRPDVVAAVRALRPSVIRFGGSALDEPGFGEFEWRDTVGPIEGRKPFRAWGGLQPLGPGLEEFVAFCRAVDAEPMICVRFSNRTPKDAADEVEYFNGAADTPMGSLRARNGHPEPHRIRYWQVGNERQSRDYDEGVAAFCEAMKRVDPNIRILSSFPTEGSLRKAGAHFAYVCPHHYTPDLGACEADLGGLRRMLATEAPGLPIHVAVTEWNTTAGDWGTGRATLMTLGNALACSRYHNLLHRNCDLVEIANRSNLINSFGSGIVQTDNHRLYVTPTYRAQWLYANLAGTRPLRTDPAPSPAASPDVSVTLSADGAAATLFAVNDRREPAARRIDLREFGASGRRVRTWTLADRDRSGERDVRNGFGDPDRVAVREASMRTAGPVFLYEFPALSLTVLQWRVTTPTAP